MSGSDDEFSAFDFSEFTEDDLKQIDAGLDLQKHKGSPKVMVELEIPPEWPEGTPRTVTSSNQPTDNSPYKRYRRNGVLSVTDLASLAWLVCHFLKRKICSRTYCRRCEVQFDYGLLQRRSKPITSRPTSFVSAKGKEIFVKQSVAVKNDHTTKQGKVGILAL
jgi:exonuclease V